MWGAAGKALGAAGAAVLAIGWLGRSRSHSALPFGGQFPVARLSGAEFLRTVGLPPGHAPGVPRPHGVFALFSSSGGRSACESCADAERYLRGIASRVAPAVRLQRGVHFVVLDHVRDAETFRVLGVRQAPLLLYLPPTTTRGAGGAYEAQRLEAGATPADMAAFVVRHAGISLESESRLGHGPIAFGLCASGVLLCLLPRVTRTPGRLVAGILGALAVLYCSSGALWVRARLPPLTGPGGRPSPAPSVVRMYAVEAHVALVLHVCGALALGLIGAVRGRKEQPVLSGLACVLLCVLAGALSSVETLYFSGKLASYPLRYV